MIRLSFTFAFVVALALPSSVYAQTGAFEKFSVSGQVTRQNQPVPDAIIYLLSGEQIAKVETSDQRGNFIFPNIPKGEYGIRVSLNGLTLYSGSRFIVQENMVLPPIVLTDEIKKLDEVIISKEKPYLERQQGKTILNVDSAIGSTGSSAFELLEKAPGVTVDPNDNITLRGKGGILVQIDGKITPLSGSNLANYLRGIAANSVDKIEFITNPGAKYDASGSAIINIKMKKDRKRGTNGSATASYGQGKYPRSNNSLSLNHRNNTINIYGTYSFTYSEWFNDLDLNRQFFENGNFTGRYDQNNSLKMNFRNHIMRLGTDWYATQNHTFGVTISGVDNRFNPTGRNISDVYNENNDLDSRFTTENRSRDKWHNATANLNHKFAIDTLVTEITTDFDYGNFGNATKQNFYTHYYGTNGVELQPQYNLHGDLDGNLNLYSFKSDYSKTFKNQLKIETGIKSTYVNADNNLAFYDVSSAAPVFDDTKSNHFIYTENINAAYLNFSRDIGKWGLYLGLRFENTNITGNQVTDNNQFDDSYTQFFPSVLASYKFNDKNSLELNYSRRITRPSYEQLNPFKFFLDQTTYKVGNPFLQPQTTHSVEMTHVYNQKIYSTLSFSRTFDNITGVIAPSDDDPMITEQTDKNLSTADIMGLFVIMPLDFANWWNTNYSFNFYYGSYSGTVAGTTLSDRGNFTFNCNLMNTFKLVRNYTAEFTGNYRAREIYAFMDVDPIWTLSLGLQKKFKNNSVLKLNVNDVFWTNRTTADTEFDNYKEHFKVSRNTRMATVSYTYNFGQNTGFQRRKTGGADDIKQRAGGSNG